jgi:predicted DNA-binding protein YlxM (UPF0122 family)
MSQKAPSERDIFLNDFYNNITLYSTQHKQFEIGRAYYYDKMPVKDICDKFSVTKPGLYNILDTLCNKIKSHGGSAAIFVPAAMGRKPIEREVSLVDRIIDLRKKNLSVPEIKTVLDASGFQIGEKAIFNILLENGFSRIGRRDEEEKQVARNNMENHELIQAAKSTICKFKNEHFFSDNPGILTFLPIIKKFGIDELIMGSGYPETECIPKISCILSFLALKLSNIERYSSDNIWCMDRGMGLFAGLNVLPKSAWFSSYSDRVTREMNIDFLKSLNNIWANKGLLSDTVNLDFTTIPYWGDESPFENNWSGKRSKALPSILAVLANDPQSGIVCYGDTTVKHENSSKVIIEFLDFYSTSTSKFGSRKLQYLIFDSKFTTYANLGKLDQQDIKFITIQRKGRNLLDEISAIPTSQWKQIRVPKANNKSRILAAYERKSDLYKYNGKNNNHTIRQVIIKRGADDKPAIIITNDFDISIETVVRKYALRWLVEKEISEQIHFFHLNSLSSGIVVKVDFDLTISILAHNLYRLMAMDLPGYSHSYPRTIYSNFIQNSGIIYIADDIINVNLKKKKALPVLLNINYLKEYFNCSWLDNKSINFNISSTL